MLPKLEPADDQLTLTFRVQNLHEDSAGDTKVEDDAERADVRSVVVEPDQILTLPGIVARAILEHLNAELEEPEIRLLETPQFQHIEALQSLSNMAFTFRFGKDDRDLIRLCLINPRSRVAWEIYGLDSRPAEVATERLSRVIPQLNCERLNICAAQGSKATQ